MSMKIGLCQLNSGEDKEKNLRDASAAIRGLADGGASLIMLPEHFNYLGPEQSKRDQAEEMKSSRSLDVMRNLADKLNVYLHIGSFLERDGENIHNTGVVFDPSGETVAVYRKIHLFDVSIPGGKSYLESETITAGDEPVSFKIGDISFGMATCYDLRFPELFRRLVSRGVTVFLLPAAFTLQTGRDHWELLLRARAVENLCWVAAAGQWGPISTGHVSFGRSMVVNPWGTVIVQASDGVTTISAEIDMGLLHTTREKFPALDHLRKYIF